MTKISDNINSYQNLASYNADMRKEYPNVSYLIDEEEVKWNKYDPDHIVCVYNVTSTSSATKLLNSSSGITYQIIDGVKQQYIQKTYTFNTLGEHIVKYKLTGTSISDNAFRSCSALTSVTIPNSVTSIGVSVFGGCSGLTSITVDADNTVYDSRNNCNAIIETATNKLIQGCQNTVIPNTVTSIGNSAFYRCSSLTSVTIPSGVTNIGNSAFRGCSSLTSITIPNSVTNIGNSAFYDCSSLTSVTVEATTPPELAYWDAFQNTNVNLVIYVPAASLNSYKTTGHWSTYASRIQAI